MSFKDYLLLFINIIYIIYFGFFKGRLLLLVINIFTYVIVNYIIQSLSLTFVKCQNKTPIIWYLYSKQYINEQVNKINLKKDTELLDKSYFNILQKLRTNSACDQLHV